MKIFNRLIEFADKLFMKAGCDGLKHIVLSSALTAILNILLPFWVAGCIVLIIGIVKEIYDKISRKGTADIKDIICDFIGIVIGII